MTNDKTLDIKINNTDDNIKKIVPKQENKVIIQNGQKYELIPTDELPTTYLDIKEFESFLDATEDDDLLYQIDPRTNSLTLDRPSDDLISLDGLTQEEVFLLISNKMALANPKTEKKLEFETMPMPIQGEIKMRAKNFFIMALISFLAFYFEIASHKVFYFLAFYGLVQALNVYNIYTLSKTRNFKVFTGVVSKVIIENKHLKSIRKSYLQVKNGPNGPKYLTIPFYVKHPEDYPEGSPVTIFLPNNIEIKESEYGPMAERYLAVTFSLDVKSSNIEGEYQDGRMLDTNALDYFEDN